MLKTVGEKSTSRMCGLKCAEEEEEERFVFTCNCTMECVQLVVAVAQRTTTPIDCWPGSEQVEDGEEEEGCWRCHADSNSSVEQF